MIGIVLRSVGIFLLVSSAFLVSLWIIGSLFLAREHDLRRRLERRRARDIETEIAYETRAIPDTVPDEWLRST